MSDLLQQLEEKSFQTNKQTKKKNVQGSSNVSVPVEQMSYVSAMIYFAA